MPSSPTAQAQFGITLASLNTRRTAVEAKTTPLSYNAATKLLTVSVADVMIIDGTSATQSSSGLSNLQVGYNGLRGSGDVRTGSHNLIVGDLHNYSKSGGLVVGLRNEISGRYTSVSGGTENGATGNFASVSGVEGNEARGPYTSISSGFQNLATSDYASISGGAGNTASGILSSISGGASNSANGAVSSVHGGRSNTSSGDSSSILGGNRIVVNTLNGTYPAGP